MRPFDPHSTLLVSYSEYCHHSLDEETAAQRNQYYCPKSSGGLDKNPGSPGFQSSARPTLSNSGRLLVGDIPGYIQESFFSLRDFEVGWILGLPGPSPSHEGWRKSYLGWGTEGSQTILQFMPVLHIVGVKAELVPLCR